MTIMNPDEINKREKELIQKKLDKISYPFINDENCDYYYETELVRRDLDCNNYYAYNPAFDARASNVDRGLQGK